MAKVTNEELLKEIKELKIKLAEVQGQVLAIPAVPTWQYWPMVPYYQYPYWQYPIPNFWVPCNINTTSSGSSAGKTGIVDTETGETTWL